MTRQFRMVLGLFAMGCAVQAIPVGDDEDAGSTTAALEVSQDATVAEGTQETATMSRLPPNPLVPPSLPGVAAARAFYDRSHMDKPREDPPLTSFERPSFPADLVEGDPPSRKR